LTLWWPLGGPTVAGIMTTRRWCFTTGGSGVAAPCGWAGQFRVLLAAGAIALAALVPGITRASQAGEGGSGASASAWPADARSTARAVAAGWSAEVRATAVVGIEPPGRCQAIDGRHAACPIAIVVLVSEAAGQRPWRCSATALVSRAGDQLVGRRSKTRCVRFPAASAAPPPIAVLGAAYAIRANGDVACLPANDGRATCVMRYRGRGSERCLGAASVPRTRPERSFALGTPVCRR
jgi:hypothetical protein